MVFKSLDNEAPSYISDLLELKKSNYSLRSANGINLQEQRSKLKYRKFSIKPPEGLIDFKHSKGGLIGEKGLIIFSK